MKAILGIGNHGSEYVKTRHNAGFFVVDQLAERAGVRDWRSQWQALTARIDLPGADGTEQVLLIKPQTYVNLSGQVAQAVLAFHKLAPADLLVVVDDIHLALGDLRLRPNGSSGGHNGLKDIESRIGAAYPRLRLGIGKPEGFGEQIDYVLSRFTPAEQADVDLMTGKAADAATAWVREGVVIACKFNGPLRPPVKPPRPPQPPRPPADLQPPAPAV
jgi:PTH1 family peptidyl-tRNA hydrolase